MEFNERMALKMRLEQLAVQEIKLMERMENERSSILTRLIEIDELDFKLKRENYDPHKLVIQ